MFAKRLDGSAVCIADYKDIKAGAIVPESNELFTQVTESVTKSGWKDLPPPPPPTAEELLTQLISVCDQKQDDAIKMLLGYKATAAQIERYKRKYERALKNEFSAEENDAIIAAHEGFLTAIDGFADLIEYARTHTATLIEAGELVKAKSVIDQAKDFDSTTTFAQVEALFV